MIARIAGRLLCCWTMLALAVPAFAQGVYTEGTTSGGPLGDRTVLSKTYMMPKMYRHESGTGEVAIIRLDKEILYTLNPADKTYAEITFTEMQEVMKKAGARMDSDMAGLQEKMKDMPQGQRDMMEKMMAGRMPGKGKEATIDVKATGEKKVISGYACSKYVATQDGKEFITVWATRDVKEFESIKKDWEAFTDRMMSMNPINGKAMVQAFKKMDGFPIQTETSGITMIVTKVEKRATPVSQFEVPPGYTKTESPLKSMKD